MFTGVSGRGIEFTILQATDGAGDRLGGGKGIGVAADAVDGAVLVVRHNTY